MTWGRPGCSARRGRSCRTEAPSPLSGAIELVRKTAKFLSALAALAVFILSLPSVVIDGVAGWKKWLEAFQRLWGEMAPSSGFWIDVWLYGKFGPGIFFLSIAGMVSWWLYYYPPRRFVLWWLLARGKRELLELRMSAREVAVRCEGLPTLPGMWILPGPRRWLREFDGDRTFFLDKRVSLVSSLSMGEWLPIVHAAARRLATPTPRFFQRAMRSLASEERLINVARR